MLRTSQESNSNHDIQGYSIRTVRQSIEADPIAYRASPHRERETASHSSSKPYGLPEQEQSRIYHDWITAGREHVFVCSGCYLPENLMGCETCCRSYHAQCLPTTAPPIPLESFHCPSCKAKGWDRVPPSPPATSSSSISKDTTPTAPSGFISPSYRGASGSARASPWPGMSNIPGVSSAMDFRPEGTDAFEHDHSSTNLSPIADMYPHILGLLAQPDRQDMTGNPDFIYQLHSMMQEVQSHRSLLQKAAVLREEFSRVQTENIQIRTYLNSRLPSREPTFLTPSTFSPIPRPSPDTSGRSWDSIVLDLI